MKNKSMAVICLGITVGILSWAQTTTAVAADAEKGKPLYDKHCVLCHGPEGKGDGPVGGRLKPPATNFASPDSRSKSDAEWLANIKNGVPDTAMTPWQGILTAAQMEDVVAYLRRLVENLKLDPENL